MLLVPRQLVRAGMTGDVPFYGGRFSPAQAYAASHPARRPPPSPPAPPPPSAPSPSRSSRQPLPAGSASDALAALQHLLDTGVLRTDEYRRLRARVTG
jgi:hypothetical protein